MVQQQLLKSNSQSRLGMCGLRRNRNPCAGATAPRVRCGDKAEDSLDHPRQMNSSSSAGQRQGRGRHRVPCLHEWSWGRVLLLPEATRAVPEWLQPSHTVPYISPGALHAEHALNCQPAEGFPLIFYLLPCLREKKDKLRHSASVLRESLILSHLWRKKLILGFFGLCCWRSPQDLSSASRHSFEALESFIAMLFDMLSNRIEYFQLMF